MAKSSAERKAVHQVIRSYKKKLYYLLNQYV